MTSARVGDGLPLSSGHETAGEPAPRMLAEAGVSATSPPPNGETPSWHCRRPDGSTPASANTHRRWDMIRAELFDTIKANGHPKRPCLYCGTMTKAQSQVCTAHSDLPQVDPHLNVQAGRYA